MTKIMAYIFKLGGCYALYNYVDDVLIQMSGILFFIGITISAVDELRKDSNIKQ